MMSVNNIVLFPHGGSSNHGCEAIVRSTVGMLSNHNSLIRLITSSIEQDIAFKLNDICDIVKDLSTIDRVSIDYIRACVRYYLEGDKAAYDDIAYKNIFKGIDNQSIALSIGGDNYCYGTPNLYMYFHRKFKEKHAKTVLWGCSVEPNVVNGEVAKDLASYDLITARESITYEVLHRINPNTVLCSDPAFALKTEYLPLPNAFLDKNTVGINISPMIISNESKTGIVVRNYERLIDFILSSTSMNIALIPHVCWPHNNDLEPLTQLYDKYLHTQRIALIGECNCMQLKGFIARCRFFIGARTHATIAAYSSCVPTLVTGYSVKASGIAKDIFGTEEQYVIPVQVIEREDELEKGFEWLMQKEVDIRTHLSNSMPEYISRAYVDVLSLL